MKMRKSFNILLALVITFFTLPFGGITALADELDPKDLTEGVYTLDYTFLTDGTDEPSIMDGFTDGPAYVKVDKDGNQLIELTFTSADMIKWFKVSGNDVKVIEEDKEANTRIVEFAVDDITNKLGGSVYVEVPGMYSTEHDVDLIFHTDSLEAVNDSENPDDSEENDGEDNGEDEEGNENEEEKDSEDGNDQEESDQSAIDLENGSYTMDASFLHDEEEKPSAMANYMDSSVFLTVDGDKVELTITVNENETVTKLQVNGKDAIETVVDGEKRYETFELDELLSLLNAYAEYQAPYEGGIFEGKADFRIFLDAETEKSADASDKPGFAEKDPNEDPKKDPEEDPKGEDPEEDPKPKEEPKEEDLLTPDKAYEIDYDIYHEDGSKPSISNDFFEKPALLLEKDGKKYIQMKITNGDMIKELKNKYGEALLVKENNDGSIVVQLRVNNDLSDMLLDMHIVVPGGTIPGFPGYDEKHKAILVFDKDSLKEIDVGDHMLVGTSDKNNDNGPTIEDGEPGQPINNGDPKKPKFGNGDNGDNGEKVVKSGKTDNPKTGDTTSIILYTLLLIGSVIPLAVKLRRRFV